MDVPTLSFSMCIRGTFDQRSIKDEIINEVNMWNIREVPPGGGQASQYFLNPLQIDNILNEVNIILETLRPTAESYTFISFLFAFLLAAIFALFL